MLYITRYVLSYVIKTENTLNVHTVYNFTKHKNNIQQDSVLILFLLLTFVGIAKSTLFHNQYIVKSMKKELI